MILFVYDNQDKIRVSSGLQSYHFLGNLINLRGFVAHSNANMTLKHSPNTIYFVAFSQSFSHDAYIPDPSHCNYYCHVPSGTESQLR